MVVELLSSHHYKGVRSEGVGPEVDFLHCHPPPLFFCWTMFSLGLFLGLGGGGCGADPTDIAQDWGVGNPGGLGNGKGSGTLGSGCSLVLAGFGNGK